MTQQIEIEFKNMLTKRQYEQLLEAFSIKNEQIIRQVNHYFDTKENDLKKFTVLFEFVSWKIRLNLR